ncbi:hypothetical protein EON63_24025 [archaeon]|nr:MAG: hypothetical protein EON63_24025 [archaeon]
MKSAVLGNEDFALSDLLTSEFDLQYASRNFKFGLVPKVSSELVASSVHEFLAHDEKTYKMWTEALTTVVRLVRIYTMHINTYTIHHTPNTGPTTRSLRPHQSSRPSDLARLMSSWWCRLLITLSNLSVWYGV